MLTIDHVCLGSPNIYESAHRFTDETGIGTYDGGYFLHADLATRNVPCGELFYIEIEGPINHHSYRQDPIANWFESRVADGDTYIGWCLRVDTEEELAEYASRWGSNVLPGVARVRPRDLGQPTPPPGRSVTCAPYTVDCWDAGLPNIFHFPDLALHGSAVEVEHTNEPHGLAWLEIGGTSKELRHWLGDAADDLPIEYVGGPRGLRAVALNTAGGVITVRR